jgi:3-dehydroquinate synthase
MAETLTVSLGARSYPILFGAALTGEVRAEVDRLVAGGRKLAVVTDRRVAEAQGATLRTMFGLAPVLTIEPGEESKSLAGLAKALDFLASERLDRSSALFAVGGGVIGDLAGFAAASYLRGIDYFQVPTTLLSMVDSSVGGKTGINLAAGKNLAGAFHQPRGVFIATGFLDPLPAREFAAGAAEVIKYGLLGDGALFQRLEKTPLAPTNADLPEVIRRCCEIKARIVEADERELAEDGGRALLNLGHTFAHAIEQATGYGAYLHGEAVAIGLVAAARLSAKIGDLKAAEAGRIEAVIARHQLPLRLRKPIKLADLRAAMGRDKKVRAGKARFVVIRKIGEAAVRADVAPELVEACWLEAGAES